MPRLILTTALVFCFAYLARAQQAPQEKTETSRSPVEAGPNVPLRASLLHLPAPSAHRPVITGAPYSADLTVDRIQTLADGTHITQKTESTRQYRDSHGRTRTETSPGGRLVAEIHDPVSGFRYLLDVENHVAHRFSPPPEKPSDIPAFAQTARPNPVPANSAPARDLVAKQSPGGGPQTVTESLGTQTMEGIYVEGLRETTTFPVGSLGNDRPLIRVIEFWTSPELKITVLSKSSDPRMGESTTQLRKINRTEPDPALFAVPADYQVVDESGDRVELKFAHP